MSLIYETLKAVTRPLRLFKYAEHVIQWNAIAANARGGELTPFDKQMGFLQEEFKETLEALRVGDKIEVVDGVCDMFVVASYAEYLRLRVWPSHSHSQTCSFDPSVKFSLIDLEEAIMIEDNSYTALQQVVAFALQLDVNLQYNLEEVLASNDSKYPTMEQLRAAYPDVDGNLSDDDLLAHEAQQIELREEGKYSGVTAVLNKETGQYVFLSDGGKIVKPITFRKPKIIV